MTKNNGISRRTALKLTGATVSTTLVAGCSGGDPDNGATDDEAWADVDEIVLDGFTQNWVGIEPEPIADEENPTLVLTEGQEYDLTWENADGGRHNIALWDADREVIESTEYVSEQGATQTLTIEATPDMDQYVCDIHVTTMIGDIEVR